MEIKNIRIIICTSDDSEMIKDGRQIKALANELNNKSNNAFIIVENVRASQVGEYLAKLHESELVFVLFYDSVSKEQREYFDRAVSLYKEKSNPVVVPYIKYVDDIDNVTEEISALQEYIGDELHLYYKSYGSSEALKLAVMLQLCQSGYVGLDVSIKDGKISYGTDEEIDTANIPMFANNDNLSSLKSTLAKLDKTLTGYFENPTPEKQEKYKSVLAKRSALMRQIVQAEKDLLEKMKEFVSSTSGGELDTDQMMAYRFMENGDVELALELLDSTAICEDLKNCEKAIETAKENMQRDIYKLCQRIDALDMMALTPEIMKEKQALLEEIRGYILKYPELNPIPLYRYAIFLKQHNNTAYAYKLAEEFYGRAKDKASVGAALNMMLELSVRMGLYEKAIEYGNIILSDNASHPSEVAAASYHLARVYHDMKEYETAEGLYIRSAETESELAKVSPYSNDKLSAIYQSLAALYKDMCTEAIGMDKKKYIEKALLYCEKSVSAARRMVQYNDAYCFKVGLAESLQAMGTLLASLGYREEATECFAESEDILKILVSADPEAYESKLASLYRSIATLFASIYYGTRQSIDVYLSTSSKYYEKAIGIYQRYIISGETRFAGALADIYEELGKLYYNNKNPEKAIVYFDRQTAIVDSVKYDDEKNYHMLSALYERNGRVYAMLKNEDKSMGCHIKSVNYCIKLVQKEPTYLGQLVIRLSSMLDSILRIGGTDAAYNVINEYVGEYCTLARQGGHIYEERIAHLFSAFGNTASDRGELHDAIGYYMKAVEFYEKVADDSNTLCIERLAELSAAVAMLLCSKAGDKENGILYLGKAFGYYGKLTESDFHKYADDFIKVTRTAAVISLELSEEAEAYDYFMECIRACKGRLQENPKSNLWIFTDCQYNIARLLLSSNKQAAGHHIKIAYEFCKELKETDEERYNDLMPKILRLYDIIIPDTETRPL